MAGSTAAPPIDRSEAIQAAALELFAEHTFAGCNVPSIAERAGVATGTIYRYFPSKEALVNTLYRRWKGELRSILVAERPAGLSLREEFHHWWSGLSHFAEEHPTAFAFLELHHHEPYLDDESRALALEVDAAALDFAVRGQQAGLVRDGNPALLVAMVFGAFAGVVRAQHAYGELLGPDPLPDAEAAVWDLVRSHTTGTQDEEEGTQP